MDALSLPQLSTDAASDYGSDIDLPSDYGSDLDIEEQLLGEVLAGIAANTLKPEAVSYPSIESDDDETTELAAVIHKLSPSAVRFSTVAAEIPHATPKGKRRASIEVEYDRHSRQSWSGTIFPSIVTNSRYLFTDSI
jgi:exonuclease V